uniref:Uncharacterized protein n=2 Tax=unclassified Virgaviridae TaxID=1527522 RepID=A0A6B9KP37_9VIRU|nr:hypothetical protein [Atrato Virga-like virus 6]QHA33783.1 hypothetical protein [Atrato Virga-like virus 7]
MKLLYTNLFTTIIMVSNATRRSRNRVNGARRSFLDTLWLSVLKCAAHPVTFCVVVFLILFVASEVVVSEGPFEYIDKLLKAELKTDLSKTEKFLLTLIEKLFNLIAVQKKKVAALLGYIVPLIVNPTKSKLVIFASITVVVLAFPSITVYSHLITALALFFYLNIGKIEYRALIAFLYIVSITIYLHVATTSTVKPTLRTNVSTNGK